MVRELETKNAELERFTYTVSHDLKSPLVTIRGFLGLLERDAEAGRKERMERDVEKIRGATETMGRLLDELLELSRIGRLVNPPQEVDLAERTLDLLRDMAEFFQAFGPLFDGFRERALEVQHLLRAEQPEIDDLRRDGTRTGPHASG